MRNPNGFGSIYKLSGKRRKPYVAVVTTGYTIEGKQKRKSLGSFETKVQAIEKLTEYFKNPDKLNMDKITFKQVYDMWSKEHYKTIREGTRRNFEGWYNKYLQKFNDYAFKDIKLIQVQEFFNNLELATGSIKIIKTLLNMIFSYALKNEIIEKNIIEFVELRKHKPELQRKVFTAEEIQKLWDNINVPFADTVLIMIYTGLRVGELLNLKNEDINLEENIISVKESKTETGIRDVPIKNSILKLITKRMILGNVFFITDKNRPVLYNKYRRIFTELLKKLEIAEHTIHDCRHTTATLLSDAGANQISIAKIMGHTDYNITATVYTHKNKTELKKAMELIQ